MQATTVEVATRDGVMPCGFFGDAGPGVIFYMDAIGVRPALEGMAGRFAEAGYRVLLPNLFYRAGPWVPVSAGEAFKEGPAREKMMALYRSLNQKVVMEDTETMLAFLEKHGVKGKVGCVGYCMGGAYALSAAGTFPERIGAAAALHGARLATDQGDSPHLLLPRVKGAVYVGIAGIDPHFTPEERGRLERALVEAGVRHEVEMYEGVKHGFAVTDTPAYDRAASERHFDKVLELFGRELGWAPLCCGAGG